MIKQLICKSFYDGIDNFLQLILLNLVFTACAVGIGFAKSFILIPLIVVVASFHLLGVNGVAYGISRGVGKTGQNYKCAIRKVGHFVVFTLMLFVVLVACFFVTPWYFSAGKFVWYAVGFVVAYLALTVYLALSFYYPLCLAYDEDGPFETLKKSFVVVFDNFSFAICCFLKNLVSLALSVVTVFIYPGFSGISASQNSAVHFIILRYDWMKDHNVDKHGAPADLVLEYEMEKYQGRNLRSFLFPGK